MIFQKHSRKSADRNFNIDNKKIEIVQQYNYFGTCLTPMRNFTLALEHLKEKALFLQLMDLIQIKHITRFLTQSLSQT